MIDFLEFHARNDPQRHAATDLTSRQSWNYAELSELTARCATALAQRGINRGDRVACLAKNRVGLVVTHLACARMGAIYVPLNWRWSAPEITRVVDEVEPGLVLGDDQLGTLGLAGTPLDDFVAELADCEPHAGRSVDPDSPSLILFTSGTSGHPKGAVVTERNLSESALNFSQLGCVTRDSVFLCDAPMFHIIGLVTNVRTPLMQGGRFLVSDGFNAQRTLGRLSDPELHVTHYFCVPQMADALRAEPGFDPQNLNGLTALFTGGAPHPAANIIRWLDDGLIVTDGYGMSETGTVCGMPLDAAVIRQKAGSAGISTERVHTRIVNDGGVLLEPGEEGELQVQGENTFREYWRQPEETRAAFTDDGWFRTGDIAIRDEDGFHWIVDRKKDMYISGGENVYPAEIEAVLAAHESIVECAVVGVPAPRWGEVGHLFAVVRPGSGLHREDILAFLEAHIARYKIPKYVSLIDSLPRNANGKILKKILKTRHEETFDGPE